MILHLIVVHDTGAHVAGGICPIRTCLVQIAKIKGLPVSRILDLDYMLELPKWGERGYMQGLYNGMLLR